MGDSVMCPQCRGRLHVPSPDGRWQRCVCVAQTARNAYIHPALRAGDLELSPAYATQSPRPLTSAAFTGAYDVFRFTVWRALDAYRPMPYLFLTNTRVSDIYFERDEQYPSLQMLREAPPLVILTIGVGDIPHKWSGLLAFHLVTLRELHGLPVWVYAKSVLDLTGFDADGRREGRELAAWVVKHLVAGVSDWAPSREVAPKRALPEPPVGRRPSPDPVY